MEVRFSGGEPLLFSSAMRSLILFVQSKGVTYTLNTNGSLLHTQLEFLVCNPPRIVWTSVNSLDDRVYRSMSGVDADVNAILTNVDWLLRHNVSVGVNILMTTHNRRHIPCMVVRLADLGVREFKLLDLTHLGRGRTASVYNLSTMQLVALFADIQSLKLDGEIRVRMNTARLPDTRAPVCLLGERLFPTLSHDGRLYLCYQMMFRDRGDRSRQVAKAISSSLWKELSCKGRCEAQLGHPPCLFTDDTTRRCPIFLERIV